MVNFSPSQFGVRSRSALVLCLCLLALAPFGRVSELVASLLVEAYIGVSIFVILTLSLVSAVENLFDFNLGEMSQNKPRAQILLASCIGALPGCGGAIMVVTYYLRGQIRFSGVVAALTATMGDAAFLLLSKKPLVALAVISLAFCSAVITGYLVQFFHGSGLDMSPQAIPKSLSHATHNNKTSKPCVSRLRNLWWLVAVPGVFLGLLNVFLLDSTPSPLVEQLTFYVGLLGAGLTLSLWAVEIHDHSSPEHSCHKGACAFRVIESDTSFITFWVVVSFLVYNMIISIVGLDLAQLLVQSAKYFLPLVAILIGFIPGCGPQIIVTSLYIQGVIPFSSQIGNAISTDGDALFPALAMAPRASIIATAYSAIPALVVAYGYLFLFE